MIAECDGVAGNRRVQAVYTVHVVVTCTDRKTRLPCGAAHARNLPPHASLAERFARWQDALVSSTELPLPAAQLYAGDHWQVVRSLADAAPAGVDVRTWVCSAGYGLIGLETPVRPYAATFDPSQRDAVAPRAGGYDAAAWWSALATWSLTGAEHRTIADVARSAHANGDLLLVALSEQYLTAVRDDAAAAAEILGDRFLLLSAGARAEAMRTRDVAGARLAERLLPANARLKSRVGGAMQSLNARLARHALQSAQHWMHDPNQLRTLFSQWSTAALPAEPMNRTRSDDEPIKAYIREALGRNPAVRHTSLLRAMRDSGRACEQSRFRALFNDVRAERAAPAGQPAGEP